MKTILSTKKLSEAQQQLVLNAGLGLVHMDFIDTAPLNFEYQDNVSNAIFTSKNGVNAVLKHDIKINNAFCVGFRTKELLEQKGITVSLAEKNGATLGKSIANRYKKTSFVYFCAEDRLDILPNKLAEANINVKEIAVYKTVLTPKKVNSEFDGVLFFSPSAVNSFFKLNKLNSHAFCIGNTTASALKKHITNYTVAKNPSIENVLVTAINYFKAL